MAAGGREPFSSSSPFIDPFTEGPPESPGGIRLPDISQRPLPDVPERDGAEGTVLTLEPMGQVAVSIKTQVRHHAGRDIPPHRNKAASKYILRTRHFRLRPGHPIGVKSDPGPQRSLSCLLQVVRGGSPLTGTPVEGLPLFRPEKERGSGDSPRSVRLPTSGPAPPPPPTLPRSQGAASYAT